MGLCGSSPEPPDYGNAAREGVLADIETLPLRTAVEAAAAAGKKIVFDGKTYDFTGLGDADYQAQTARQFAEALLASRQKHGEEFVRQSLAELNLSNPEGEPMRQDLYDRIMREVNAQPDRPLAEAWNDRALAGLKGEGGLTDRELRDTQQAVRGRQAAGGITLGTAAASQEAGAIGQAGDAKRNARQQFAEGLLKSGTTPEQVEARRLQQSISNLSAFEHGVAPTAQFSQLSGAQQGASPFASTYQGPQLNQNAGPQGYQVASNNYNTIMRYNNQQANPYLAGLSTAASAYPIARQAFGGGGYTPPAGTVTTGGSSYEPGYAPVFG